MSNNLLPSEEILNVLNKTIEIFTSHKENSFEDVMANGLRPIAEAIGLDRIDIYHRLGDNSDQFGQFYRWLKSAGGTAPTDKFLEVLPNLPIISEWVSVLVKDECIIRRLDKMTAEEIEFSNALGIKSFTIMPIFTYGELWGMVTFQDLSNVRDFDEYIDAMHSVSRLCAGVSIREELRRKNEISATTVMQREKMLEVLNKMAVILISQSETSFEKKMTEGLSLVCDMVNLDRASFFRNTRKPDGLHTSQIYRWSRDEGGTTESLTLLRDIKFAELAPRWEKILEEDKITSGPARLMPEAEMLKSFGVLSVLVVPIFIKNSLWGFGFFEDTKNERYFDEVHVEIMRSAAFLCTNVVMRYEMEDEISENMKFNDTLLNSAPMAITISDDSANMIDCNVTASKMFDCSKEYFIQHFYDLSPEYQPDGTKSKEKIKDLLIETTKKGQVIFDWMHRSASGEPIPCEINLARMPYMGKHILLVYIYDLRNIKKMEALASEAKEMARAIAEASPISYILFDENLQVADCNEAAAQVLKSPSKQYLLENYWNIFATKAQPDGQNSYDKSRVVLNKALSEGKHSFEWVQRTFDGEDVPMENTLYPLIFKDKKFIISFKYDLRKYKNMMDEMRKQSDALVVRLEQQQLVSEISKNFILHGDSDTHIYKAMDKLGKSLGVSRVFIFSMSYEQNDVVAMHQWYANDDLPKLRSKRDFNIFDMVTTAFTKNLSDTIAPTISCSDVTASTNKSFHALATGKVSAFMCTPIYVEGSLWGIIEAEYCYEPHEWTGDEKALFAIISNIIAGAIMRNIYDTKLKDSLDKVTSLSKAKDEFLSKISHEIRTPMNAILGITEIQLQDDSLPMAVKDNLNIIYNSGDSLLRIINDLLDLSKIEARKLEITPTKYEVASLINDTAQLNMMRIESKPIEFILDVDENIPSELFGDELRLKQIMNNILSNAFKYTDSGKVTMSVWVEKNDDKEFDIKLIFKVNDTGRGMTKEQVNKIFDEFARFNLSSSRYVEGTGLGMTITRNLVYLMNGDINVESELGKGSVFIVSLPQKTVGAGVLGKEVSENLRKFRMNNSSQLKRMRMVRDPMPYGKVLIVDDVESNLYVANKLLMPYDLTIETACSGFEAIEKVKDGNTYDIIFMDHMMPGMDGIEAVKIIREAGYKQTIIALTANAIAGQAKIFMDNGFDGFISKPINMYQMNSILNEFIRDRQPPEVVEEARHKKNNLSNDAIPTKSPAQDAALLSIFSKDAKKALCVFEATLEKLFTISDEDMNLFVVNAHAMKSAFANIGEPAYSLLAATLEKAGKENNKNTIAARVPEFIIILEAFIKNNEIKTESKFSDTDEDIGYLREQLKKISVACADYDIITLNSAIANLKAKSWTKETSAVLDHISDHILHSDFEEASQLAKKLLMER